MVPLVTGNTFSAENQLRVEEQTDKRISAIFRRSWSSFTHQAGNICTRIWRSSFVSQTVSVIKFLFKKILFPVLFVFSFTYLIKDWEILYPILGIIINLVGALYSTPYSIVRLRATIIRIIFSDWHDRINGVMRSIYWLNSLVKCALKVARLLVSFGIVAVEAIRWVPITQIVTTAIALIILPLDIKRIWDSHQLTKKIDALAPNRRHVSPEQLENVISCLENESDPALLRALEIKGNILKPRLRELQACVKNSEDAAKLVNLFRRRTNQKIFYHAFGLLVATISTIAMIVFLCSPLSPAGLVILPAIVMGLCALRYSLFSYQTREFQKKIGLAVLTEQEANRYKTHQFKRVILHQPGV